MVVDKVKQLIVFCSRSGTKVHLRPEMKLSKDKLALRAGSLFTHQ